MKNICSCLIVIISFLPFALSGQESIIELNTNHSGATHDKEARYAVLLKPGFSFNATSSTSFWAHINPNLAYPPIDNLSYNSFVDPEDRTLDKSLEVGTTAGGAGVSILGSATYTIPISLPAGANGFAPELSLVYSSQGGNGVAGYGWNISGLSAISRSPQTVFHDNQTVGVDLTNSDRFSMDGQRLICVSGNDGEDGSQYRTEIDNITRITCTAGSYGPTGFLAETKAGIEIEYGVDADARQDYISYKHLSWLVNKMTDVYDNEITFDYLNENHTNYISQILYGPNKVLFHYKERDDREQTYFKSQTIDRRLILDKIEVVYNNTLLREYHFKYNHTSSTQGEHSVLNEVIEYGMNRSRFNSTVFS
nr:SpvB/TcaC N-terminal domain-containing protein [uncultured Draconibacterium sp.]